MDGSAQGFHFVYICILSQTLQINQPKMHITTKVYHCHFLCTQNGQISEGNHRPLCRRGTPRGL